MTGNPVFVWSDVEALTQEIVDDGMHSDSDREYSSAEEEHLPKILLYLCYFKTLSLQKSLRKTQALVAAMSSDNSAVNGIRTTVILKLLIKCTSLFREFKPCI